MSELKSYTKEELRTEFIDHLKVMAKYWANVQTDEGPNSILERCEGLAFSILVAIDGCAGGFPCSLDLVARPHPDDKCYNIENGDRWIEDGTILNDDCHLHDYFHRN